MLSFVVVGANKGNISKTYAKAKTYKKKDLVEWESSSSFASDKNSRIMRPISVSEVSPKRIYTFDNGDKATYKREFRMYDSMSERIFVEFSNGAVFCAHEWNLQGNNELVIIKRMIRDSDGNLRTDRVVHKLSDEMYKAWEKKLEERRKWA